MFTRVPGVWSVKQSTWFCPIKVIFLSKKNIFQIITHLWPISCLHHCLWWTIPAIPWEEATFWQIISNESNFQTTIYSKAWIFQSWQDLSNIGSVSPPTNPFLDAAVTRKEKSGTHSDAWTGWHVGPVNHRQSPYAHNCRGGFWTSTHQISTDRNGSPEVDTTWSKSCHPGLATSIANTYFLATSNQTDKCSFLLKQR